MSLPDEFSRFPSHWDVLPFTKAIKDSTSGNVKIQKSEYSESGDIPIVDQGQSVFGGYTDDANAICKADLPTIIFGDHTRAFKYVEIPFALGADGAKVLEPVAKLDKRFLYHYLKQLRLESAGYSRHYKFLKETYVPVPPLAEQKRIAAILDKADAIRRKRQQAIQLADEFLRSVFLDMFGDPVTNPKGWDEATLMDIADIRSGVTKGKKIDLSTAVTLPYMRVANVQDGFLSLEDIQEITVSPTDAEKCKLMAGDILLTEGGDPDKLGRGHVWNNEVPNCIHQNHIFSVRVKDPNLIRPEFLSAQIASQRGKRYFLKVGKQTTGIATINKTVLSEFEPFIPPVEIQDRYIRIAKVMSELKAKSAMENMGIFESLSQRAFSGQL